MQIKELDCIYCIGGIVLKKQWCNRLLRPRAPISPYIVPYKGDLEVELLFKPPSFSENSQITEGSIKIHILGAKNLIPANHNIRIESHFAEMILLDQPIVHHLVANKWFMKSPNGPVLRPYIKLHLYPFKAAKKKTQPIEAGTDLNPVFDNHFQFKVSFERPLIGYYKSERHLVRIILKTSETF